VPHPRRVLVFAARVGCKKPLYSIGEMLKVIGSAFQNDKFKKIGDDPS
jgi:hypothetical protein